MEKTLNIYQRICAVMTDVKYVQKSDKKVNGQYSFVTHDSVAAALHDPMAKHGIVMIPNILECEQDGNRTKLKLELSFINIDNPADRIIIYQYGYGIDGQDKGIGKAQSYAVKYGLLKVFCLETGDDCEKDLIEYKPKETKYDPLIMEVALNHRKKQIITLVGTDQSEQLGTYMSQLKKAYKSLSEEELILTKTVDEFIRGFNDWKSKQQA